MEYMAVITGDIVDSTKSIAYRSELFKVLKDNIWGLKDKVLFLEIYRGDSLQILLDSPENAARVALSLRCALKSATPLPEQFIWEARLSIGIGSVEYRDKAISPSDGQAFRLSGR